MKINVLKFAALVTVILTLNACSAKTPAQDDTIHNPQNGRAENTSFAGSYTQLMQHSYTFIGEDMDPDLSPDGTTLLYASTSNSKSPDIFTKPVNGKSYTQRTYHDGNDRFPRYSPDGKWIIFASDRAGNWDLYLMSSVPNNKKPIRLTKRSGDELHPSWSPDGSQVTYNYFNGRSSEWEIWSLKFSDMSTRYICNGLMPEWCPNKNNNRIVFQRYRARNLPWYGIWTVNATPGKETEQTAIVTESKWAAINPAWSPDGTRIIFATVYKGREAKMMGSLFFADDIWMVNADGMQQQQVTNDAIPEWNPYWAHDGRIYFNRNLKGKKNIWSIRPNIISLGKTNNNTSTQKSSPAAQPSKEKTDKKDYFVMR